jgi:hypothetical protein
MQHFFVDPFFAALFGWLAFNVILFRIEKDKDDDADKVFSIKAYVLKYWDNWLASLVCVPIVLYLGYNQLSIGMIDAENPQWKDLYYLGAGFLPELVIVAWKKWKAKNQ